MSQYENPQAGQNRPLPKREQDLFKSVVKHYETKQYKKGIKAADSILKKFPNHGETLCMKGLILNMTPEPGKKEAVPMVKLGLTKDMRSHVCWHVYGLIHRSDRNYNEAIKAYKQALRIDDQNLQILRDLSLLQIQMRDLNGFAVTRHSILTLKPNQKINWLTFALAKHLIGDLKGAVSVIDIYLGTLKDSSTSKGEENANLPPDLQKNYESSELALYRYDLIAAMRNNYPEALKHLDECKHLIVDIYSWKKARGRCQLQLKMFEDAKETFLDLLKMGYSEDYVVHSGYMCSLLQCNGEFCAEVLDESRGFGGRRRRKGTDSPVTMKPFGKEERRILLRAYRDLIDDDNTQLAKSLAVRRIPLTILKHNDDTDDYCVKENNHTRMTNEAVEWRKAISTYIQRNIPRGVPSLGSDLCCLLLVEDPKTGRYVTAVESVDVKTHPIYIYVIDLVDNYIESLESKSQFPGDCDSNSSHKIEPPSTLLWAWYLRADLHIAAQEYNAALSLTSKCLNHTPTAVDVYELRGRILQLSGDVNAAADCLDEGRKLDKQDRYVNNLTTEFMLKAGREEEALSRIGMFTRHESDPEQNIFDMQCMWYELELAACYYRKGEWGKSLKKYVAVEKHFEDFNEDQFDFHSYCIRKVTIRSYVDVLRWEDMLYGNNYYTTAAEGIIRNYLHIHDNPEELKNAKDGINPANPDYSQMTPAERKKAKAQARKKKKAAEKKAMKEAEAKKLKLLDNEKNGGGKSENGKQSKKSASTVGGGGTAAALTVKDKDPDGMELLNKDALGEAKKYTTTLVKNAPNRFSTWMYQYDVSIRRGKLIMALQALHKAKTIDNNHAELFTRIVDLQQKDFFSTSESLSVLRDVFESERAKLLNGKNTVSEFVMDVACNVKKDKKKAGLSFRVAVAKAMVDCDVGDIKTAVSIIIGEGLQIYDVTRETCKEALLYLKQLEGVDNSGILESMIGEWRDLVCQYFLLN